MKQSKAIEIMMQLKAEYFYAFKDMPDELFKMKVNGFIKALSEYSDKEMDVALEFVIKENKTVPTVAHFVEVLERNRELLMTSPEKEWEDICLKAEKSSKLFKEYRDNSLMSHKEYLERSNQIFESLSDDVKEYFGGSAGFYDCKNAERQDIEKNKFLKNFPIFRREKKQKQVLIDRGLSNEKR